MAEWSNSKNGGRMAADGMAEWQIEWQNGCMAGMATYVLFMVHTNDTDTTLIFYSIDTVWNGTSKRGGTLRRLRIKREREEASLIKIKYI